MGGLPSNWGQSSAFQYLQVLDLSGNGNLEGGLPPTWGTQGAFPRLVVMNLSWTGVNGQLPAAWGSQQSFPQMTTLDLSNNILAGLSSHNELFYIVHFSPGLTKITSQYGIHHFLPCQMKSSVEEKRKACVTLENCYRRAASFLGDCRSFREPGAAQPQQQHL